ncbi:MAG: hypothetical protein KC466_05605 [Myxococcales bacterium]|nr:hypothetical protein [Myxococcales bacterium]
MKTLNETTIGKILATALLTLMVLVAARPAHAFGPISAVAAVVNAAAGTVAGDHEVPSAEALAQRARHESLAEAIFQTDKDAGATSFADVIDGSQLATRIRDEVASDLPRF